MVNRFVKALILFGFISISSQESVNLPDLDPQDAQQIIEQQDTSLKYAPKVESNVPAVRYLGNEPHNVVEDIYLANQYHGQDGLGGYLYGYSVPDIAKTEKKVAGGDLRGAYNYIANGKEIKVEYWDDGTGFHQIDNVPKNLPEDLPAVKAEKERFLKRWHEEAERNSRPVEDPYNSEGQYKEGPLSLQGQLQRQQQFAAQFGKSAAYKQPEGAASQQSTAYTSNLEKAPQSYNANYQPYQGKDQQNQGAYQSKQSSAYTQGTGYGQSSGGYGSPANTGYGSQPAGGYGQSQPTYGYSSGSTGQSQGTGGYGSSSGYSPSSGSSGYGSATSPAYGGQPSGGVSGYGGSSSGGLGAYGSKPAAGYGGQSSGGSGVYGSKPSGGASGYGGQSSGASGGYGSTPGGGYGSTPAGGYGSTPAGGYGSAGYGSKPAGGSSGYGGQSTGGYGNSGGYGGSTGYGAQNTGGSRGYGQSTGYLGQPSQNVNKYAAASSAYGQGGQTHSKYISNPGQEDDGSYKPEKDEEQGPPRGFFYKIDYPVGIIVSKQGPAQGASYGQDQQKTHGSYSK